MMIDASSYTRIATSMPSERLLSTPRNFVLPPEAMTALLKSGEQMLLVLRHQSTQISLVFSYLTLVFTPCHRIALALSQK
jgi:hypothetical protein